ncbi:MAG: class I SAM-dependent methyltransferase [candidate division WOR-3 bacterium]
MRKNNILNEKIGFVQTPSEIAKLMIMLSTVDKNSNILDTGCGEGIFLQELEKEGYINCYGIEINKELYELCKKKFKDKYKIILGDFLTYNFNEKFDLIIGNPPYIHFNQIPTQIRNNVRKIIKTSEGDIYYAFIIRSIQLLKNGGELIYIVPYSFFYNTYAKIVREFILNYGKIEIIIDLDEARIFNNENPETIIFKFKKGKFNLNQEKIILLRIKRKNSKPYEIYIKAKNSLETKNSNDLFEYNIIPHYTNTNQWSSLFFYIPNFKYILLKEIAKVGVGMVSGFDKAFIIQDDSKFTFEEGKLIKKFVKAKHCKRYVVDGYTKYILIDDSIKSEEYLKENYPNIYLKLEVYKEEMKNRYLVNKMWFNWQALRNYEFLLKNYNKKRIYVPTLDRHNYNRFSLGEEGLLPAGDVLFIQPFDEENLYFLLGYLNSSFLENTILKMEEEEEDA